jgi:hypothetical protein
LTGLKFAAGRLEDGDRLTSALFVDQPGQVIGGGSIVDHHGRPPAAERQHKPDEKAKPLEQLHWIGEFVPSLQPPRRSHLLAANHSFSPWTPEAIGGRLDRQVFTTNKIA